MTYLVERLANLRRHLDHLRTIRPRVTGPESLEADLTLHNDVLFSLLTICQMVIDIASELSSRRGDRFEDYTEAVRNLAKDSRFAIELVRKLDRLPGFRNVLVHDYVSLTWARSSKLSINSSPSKPSMGSSQTFRVYRHDRCREDHARLTPPARPAR